jgi:DNA-binding PadR family transcriptional regulator
MSKGMPSGKEVVVLRLLRDAPSGMYGLEMVDQSQGALGRGSVYVILSRMQDKGLVESRTPKRADHPGLPRPRYRITALGQKTLQAAEAAQSILPGLAFRQAIQGIIAWMQVAR